MRVWHDQWYHPAETGGRFSPQGQCIPQLGDARWLGAAGIGGFAAEPNRYHLYVSLACPWARRTLIMRALKGLEKLIPIFGRALADARKRLDLWPSAWGGPRCD